MAVDWMMSASIHDGDTSRLGIERTMQQRPSNALVLPEDFSYPNRISRLQKYRPDIVQLGSLTRRTHKFQGDNKVLHNIANFVTRAPRKCS